MSDITIAGRTLKRPFTLDGRTDVETTEGVVSIKQAIETLVLTDASNPVTGQGGERIYNRRVGLNIIRYLFRSDTPMARAGLKAELLKLSVFEPRIVLSENSIRVTKDSNRPNVWVIKLRYQIVKTGETRNQVIPIFARDNYVEILPE